MTDPKTRALSLVDELDSDRPALARALRLAITQIPTTSWQPMETYVLSKEPVRLLCETVKPDHRGKHIRVIIDYGAGFTDQLRMALANGGAWTPLAWRPADSTDPPEDWGTP